MRLAFLAAWFLPAVVSAGELSSLHDLGVRDASHKVAVKLDGRVARFRIAHTLVTADRRGDEAFLGVDLPAEGAALGLRARAAGRWFRGQALDREEADSRYETLTRSGRPGAGRGAAILTWNQPELVDLAVFPVSRRRAAEVEIEVVAPLCYAEGLAVAYYPRPDGPSVAAPRVSIEGGRRHWIVRPGRDVPAAIAARWPEVVEECEANEEDLAIAFDAEPRAPVAAAAATLDLASGRQVVWVEVDAARQLAPAPRAARVIFVLDASRSMDAAGLTAELHLVRGYLAHLPDAEFEIVLYRRRASRLLGRFQPARRAAEVLARVPARALALENGSHLDAGLELAASLSRGARGPVRVIAFNDSLVRGALGARAMAAALGRLPAGSVVHLLELDTREDAFSWLREDDHPFAPAVMSTGGMLVSMSGNQAASAREAMRGLVRPLRVDGFRIDGAALGDLSVDLDDDGSLAAGHGIHLSAILEAGAARGPLVARGRIWGRELALPIAVDRGLTAALPALVFGGSRMADLDEAEQKDAARQGGVVSPFTSLLVELDDRPTGHDEMLGSSGCGCDAPGSFHGGSGGVGTIGTGRMGPGKPPPDRQAILAGALAAPLRSCAALHGAAPLELTIETTRDEVVDVAVETRGGAALAACAVEAGWALALDSRFDQDHATFEIPLRAR